MLTVGVRIGKLCPGHRRRVIKSADSAYIKENKHSGQFVLATSHTTVPGPNPKVSTSESSVLSRLCEVLPIWGIDQSEQRRKTFSLPYVTLWGIYPTSCRWLFFLYKPLYLFFNGPPFLIFSSQVFIPFYGYCSSSKPWLWSPKTFIHCPSRSNSPPFPN